MIADQIRTDMTAAMKSGEALKLSVLRMLVSEINYKHIDAQRDLNDEDIFGVISREVKKRREAIDAYSTGGRQEQAETERKELQILLAYMPKQLSETEIEEEISKMLTGIESREFPMVMKEVSPQFRGRADGRMVADTVKRLLNI